MSEKFCKILIISDPTNPDAPALELIVGIDTIMDLEEIKNNTIVEIKNRTDWNPTTCTILLATLDGDLIVEYPPEKPKLSIVK